MLVVADDQDDGAVHTRTMVDGMAAPMALLDGTGRIVEVNLAWRQFAGPDADASLAGAGVGANYLTVCDRSAEDGDLDGKLVAAGLRDVLAGGETFRHDYPCNAPDGASRWFELSATGVPASGGVVVLHTNVTGRILGERANFLRARQDQLTGLANRLKIQEVLALELSRCSPASPLLVAFVDVDMFKHVNDSLGHAVGDLLLVELATRLQRAVPDSALLGRLGGDEFIVITPDCGLVGGADIADRIRAAVAVPFEVAGTHLQMSVSIGLAVSGDPRLPAGDLLRDADVALYAAKDGGRDRHQEYTPILHARVQERIAVLTGLRRAVRRGELRLDYQPVVDLQSGEVGGYEALMRWDDPVRGLQSPAAFIPLAEESGLIVPMSRWLLAEAAEQARRWVACGFRGKVGVNISGQHLTAGTLVDDVLEALDVAQVPAAHLILEITETALAADVEAAIAQLQSLREQGVEIAIDDFGAGYSSLGQLARLPADVLKLDRSLLPAGDGSVLSDRQEAVVGAVVTAGTRLGMHVLAEGVETPAELALVERLGCGLAQGYLLGRPEPAGDGLPTRAG